MLNHARTLLLNVTGSDRLADYPGEEMVPPEFTALELPSYLDTVRTVLFGADPDRVMLNYRVRQLLAVLHSSPLEVFLTRLDPRITYDVRDDAFISDATFLPRVTQLDGPPAHLTVIGAPAAPDASGRCRHDLTVEVVAPDRVRVQRQTPPRQGADFGLTMSHGLSNRMDLLGTGYSFRIDSDQAGLKWLVEVINRPQLDLGQIVANLEQVGETVLLQLFGLERDEPWTTFRNLWQQKKELPLKLGGLLCALVYRTEERRRGRA
jgi:hypothetical protein